MLIPGPLLRFSMWLVAFVAMLIAWPLYWIEAQCDSFVGWLACFSISRLALAGLLTLFGASALLGASRYALQRKPTWFSRGGTYLYVTNAWVWNERAQTSPLQAIGVFTLDDDVTTLCIRDCTIWYRDRIQPNGTRMRRGTWRSEVIEKTDERFFIAYQTSIENRLPHETQEAYTAIHKLMKRNSTRAFADEVWSGEVDGKGIKGKMACLRVAPGPLSHSDALSRFENKVPILLPHAPMVEKPFNLSTQA